MCRSVRRSGLLLLFGLLVLSSLLLELCLLSKERCKWEKDAWCFEPGRDKASKQSGFGTDPLQIDSTTRKHASGCGFAIATRCGDAVVADWSIFYGMKGFQRGLFTCITFFGMA